MIFVPTVNERTVAGMADMMNFPKRWEDFLHNYEFEDSRRVYTNGSRLIQSFRVEQMMEHYALRPVSREQVEKIYPGCDECKPSCGICINAWGWDGYHKPQVCEDCKECSNFEADDNYCYNCGRPLTDEAVDMILERMEEMTNEH